MKNKISLYIIACLCVAVTSCKKYLDTQPDDFYSPEQYYKNETQLNNALNGVYNALTVDGLYGRNLLIELANGTDEAFYKRTNYTTNPMLFNYDAGNNIIAAAWSALYEGINRANYLLYYIDKPAMDQKKRDVIRGEALFLRAYFYFLLVSNWNNVSMPLEPTVDGTFVNVPQTPASGIYQQILKDMITAKDLVNTSPAANSNVRVTKTAVQAILARVCLKMAGWPLKDVSKYTDARNWADSVIKSDAHRLNPDYKQIFINHSADLYDIKECIWEVEFTGNSMGTVKLGSRFANQMAVRNTNADAGYGYAIIGATPTLYNLYKSYDLRRDWNIATYGYSGNNGFDTVSKTDIYSRDSGKWRRQYETFKPYAIDWSPTNYPVIRYSDVLLMYAEADNEINGTSSQQAIDYVNQVRRRGYGKYLNGPNGVSESIKTLTLTSGGTGYAASAADPIMITFTGAAGAGARATATVTNGVISAINLISRGAGFSGDPDVNITGGGGTGATAVATIYPVSQADLQASQYANYISFKNTIQEERSRELAFEGIRRFDLIRWEKYLEALKATGDYMELNAPSSVKDYQGVKAYFVASRKHLLLPIPSADRTLNKALDQNFGW